MRTDNKSPKDRKKNKSMELWNRKGSGRFKKSNLQYIQTRNIHAETDGRVIHIKMSEDKVIRKITQQQLKSYNLYKSLIIVIRTVWEESWDQYTEDKEYNTYNTQAMAYKIMKYLNKEEKDSSDI